MHIKFEPSLLNFRDVELYKCANSRSAFIFARENGKDVKIPMPSSVCRQHKDLYYKNPTPIRILFYGDDAITFMFIKQDGNDSHEIFVNNINNFVDSIVDKELYYNGQYVYSLDYAEGQYKLTQNDFIKHVKIPSYDLKISNHHSIEMCYYDGVIVGDMVSFPLWKNMVSMVTRNYKINGWGAYISDDDEPKSVLDEVDSKHNLNLHGLLKLCDMTAKMFGSEAIEVFNLVDYIIEYNTVNLPVLPKYIRATAPTGLTISDVIAFHIGKLKKVNTYKQVKTLTDSLSFLTSYCIVRNDLFDVDNVLKGTETPKLMK